MIETRIVSRRRILAMLGGFSLVAGCAPSPKYADPEAAPKALRSVLEAWKGGKTREGFARESTIQTVDSRWDGGYKLLGYDIGPGEMHGYTLTFQVTLRLQDAKGKTRNEKATYTVATSPSVAVRRVEEM